MGILSRIATRASVVGGAHPRDPVVASWWGGGANSVSGQSVTPDTAMRVAAVFACVRVISESVAQLPLILYRQLTDGKERAKDHPLYRILHTRPNRWQTPYEFKRMLTGHAVLRGNGYAAIVSKNGAAVSELIPLHPDRVRPYWYNGAPAYEYTPVDGPVRYIMNSEMLHLRGYSDDGLVGLNPITLHREAVGLALATEDHGARLFSNGVRPSGVLKMAGHLKDDETRKRFKQSFREAYAGSAKSGETLLLEDGLEWSQVGMTSEDAQFLETRQFQRSEIASIFRVPPHKIGDLSRSTNNNIEDQSKSFIEDTLGPWITGFEQAITRDLIEESLQEELFAEFVLEALLRGNIEARYKAYATGRQWGWLSPNDVRKKENMNPIEDGDEYLKPVNMAPLGQSVSQDGGNNGN